MIYGGKAIDAFSGEITDEHLDKFLQSAGRASQVDEAQAEAVRSMEEAKGLLNIQDYAGAQKVVAGIKFSNLPEEFKFVGDIFLACSYA